MPLRHSKNRYYEKVREQKGIEELAKFRYETDAFLFGCGSTVNEQYWTGETEEEHMLKYHPNLRGPAWREGNGSHATHSSSEDPLIYTNTFTNPDDDVFEFDGLVDYCVEPLSSDFDVPYEYLHFTDPQNEDLEVRFDDENVRITSSQPISPEVDDFVHNNIGILEKGSITIRIGVQNHNDSITLHSGDDVKISSNCGTSRCIENVSPSMCVHVSNRPEDQVVTTYCNYYPVKFSDRSRCKPKLRYHQWTRNFTIRRSEIIFGTNGRIYRVEHTVPDFGVLNKAHDARGWFRRKCCF